MNVAKAVIESRRFTEVATKKLKTYPPPPEGSRYRRTFKLKGAWKPSVVLTQDIKIEILNDRHYAGWVQGTNLTGNKRQLSRFKRGGWSSLTDINRKIWPVYQIRIALALGIPLRSLRIIRF